jgi:TfoX/Sxy family transcriptional regulator of competence genes
MAFDERLAERIRSILASHDDIREQKMFGGIAWMDHGNMCVGVIRDDLMARVGADAHEASLKEPGTRPMDFAHRPMVGMLYVSPEAVATDKQLRTWVERCLAFTATLLPK